MICRFITCTGCREMDIGGERLLSFKALAARSAIAPFTWRAWVRQGRRMIQAPATKARPSALLTAASAASLRVRDTAEGRARIAAEIAKLRAWSKVPWEPRTATPAIESAR